MAEVLIGAAALVVAAPLVRSRRRRPGKVAAKVRRVHARHVARIEAQLRDLDRGLMPQPLREDDLVD